MRNPLRRARHNLVRLAETPAAFRNWPSALVSLSWGKLAQPSKELTLRTRSGITIICPNRKGSRVPVYEVFAEDCYRIGDLRQSPWLPRRVLDIGAHIGSFALQVASIAPAASIVCVEPSATAADYLERNICANGLSDRIEVERVAITGTAGPVQFAVETDGSVLNRPLESEAISKSIYVEGITFDEIIGTRGPFDLVKIDCEGSEYEIVGASDPKSWRSVERTVLEYHDVPSHSWTELEQRFDSFGLTLTGHQPLAGGRQGTAWLERSNALDH